jgi:hypothetical protein
MAKFGAEVKNLKPVLAELKKVEPETFKQLRKDIRTDVAPLVDRVKASIPANSPFMGSRRDGFNHEGRTAWNKTDPKSVTINQPTTQRGKSAQAIVMITTNSAAVSLAAKAGMRGINSGRQPKKRFNTNIRNKLGEPQRFAWKTAVQNYKLVEEIIDNIMVHVEEATNSKIKRVR